MLGHTEEVDRERYDYDVTNPDIVKATLNKLYA
jgi:hypothetical protein